MMKMLDTTSHLYSPDEAIRIAAEMQTDDEDWEYRVVNDPTGKGYSFIEIYDEDGEFVAKV